MKPLVLIPACNVAAYLPRLHRLLMEQTVLFRAVVGVSNSTDNTEAVAASLPGWEVVRLGGQEEVEPAEKRHAVPQRARRSRIARARNELMEYAYSGESHVLWLDADLYFFPRNLLAKLLISHRQICVANCVHPGGEDFDLNSFALTQEGENIDYTRWMEEGLICPPIGMGRRYLNSFRGETLPSETVELFAVGATALLLSGGALNLRFPTEPYQGYIETEGLSVLARDHRIQSYGLPNIRVIHSIAGGA